MRAAFVIYFIAVTATLAQSSFPIETITFRGTDYPREALLAATGLHVPMPFSETALRDAAQKLQNTGFFRAVQFRYEPARGRNGYAVTFDLTKDDDTMPARIDIPDVDEETVWKELESEDPLLTRQVPVNPIAQDRYLHAIERYLVEHGEEQKIAARVNGGELGSAHVTLVFEPASLPIIAAVRFTDTFAIKPADVEAVLEPIAANSGYTEGRFRQLLDLNVRPLYEERGYLGVVFDKIALKYDDVGHLTVETHVTDGRKYNLGNVKLDGANLPEVELRQAAGFHTGALANWTDFREGVENMDRVFRRRGYIHERSTVERTLHSREGTVDAVVHFAPGVQYRFGRLILTGLPPDVQTLAEGMWTLQAGQPLDAEYPREFLRAVIHELKPRAGRFSQSFPPGDAPDVLNVEIAFR
jgi:hypothetical protein